jgi:hypothetical protein
LRILSDVGLVEVKQDVASELHADLGIARGAGPLCRTRVAEMNSVRSNSERTGLPGRATALSDAVLDSRKHRIYDPVAALPVERESFVQR